MRIDGGELDAGGRCVLEDLDQRAVVQVALYLKQRLVDDASTLKGPLGQDVAVIGVIGTADLELADSFGCLKVPVIFLGARICLLYTSPSPRD